MQINFESESLKYLLHRLSLSEQNPCYRNNAIELAEQYKVDFHHNFVLNFVIKVNSIRAWDYPKIAVCTDTGCACYSLKSYSSQKLLSLFSPVYGTLLSVELKHKLGKEAQEFGRKCSETCVRRILHPMG